MVVTTPPRQQSATNLFSEPFTNFIVFPLACFDRVIFKGYHPVRCDPHLNASLDYRLRMRQRDFIPFVELQAQRLVDHAKPMAEDPLVPYLSPQGHHRNEQSIQKIIKEKPVGYPLGPVAVLCLMETYRTMKNRFPGTRIKHRIKNHRIQMYDKMGQILWFETVIHQLREFHVHRWHTRNRKRAVGWVPINKGAANLFRYREIALTPNDRYLESAH